MMKRTLAYSVIALSLTASQVAAEVVPLVAFGQQTDGPFVDLLQDASFSDAPTTMDDIIRLSDLDGNPDVITAQERQMIAMLSMMLTESPIAK